MVIPEKLQVRLGQTQGGTGRALDTGRVLFNSRRLCELREELRERAESESLKLGGKLYKKF